MGPNSRSLPVRLSPLRGAIGLLTASAPAGCPWHLQKCTPTIQSARTDGETQREFRIKRGRTYATDVFTGRLLVFGMVVSALAQQPAAVKKASEADIESPMDVAFEADVEYGRPASAA